MKVLICILLLGVLMLVMEYQAQAQGPPIHTGTPILLGLDGRGIRTFGRFISKENTNIYTQPFIVPYNLNSKLQVTAAIPIVVVSPDGMDNISGFGDVSASLKYVFLQKDGKAKTFRALVKLQETFPTGKKGISLDAYQTLVSLNTGYVTTKYGIYGEVGYNLVSDNLPDNIIYNVAFGYPLLPQQYPPKQLNLFLEFTGNHITGNNRHSLFIAPGLQYIFGRRVLVESGIQLPLSEDVPEEESTNFIYILGTRVLIF